MGDSGRLREILFYSGGDVSQGVGVSPLIRRCFFVLLRAVKIGNSDVLRAISLI